jgi:hypothetical protein
MVSHEAQQLYHDDSFSSSVSILLERGDSNVIILPDPELDSDKSIPFVDPVLDSDKLIPSVLHDNFNESIVLEKNSKDSTSFTVNSISENNPTITTDIESNGNRNIFPPPAPDSIWTTDRTCTFCISDYENLDKLRVLPCGHKFHVECIDKWYFII